MLNHLPSVAEAYDHENAFYLTCAPGRIGKLLAHYELYQRARNVAGAFVECGIFKGSSLARFAMFRHLFESEETRSLIGFDIFGKFPETDFEADKDWRDSIHQERRRREHFRGADAGGARSRKAVAGT